MQDISIECTGICLQCEVRDTMKEATLIRAFMVDVDGVVVDGRPADGQGWASSLEEDLGLASSDLHKALFEPYWDAIVTGKLSLEERLASVLADIAPNLSAHRLLNYWFENDARLNLGLLADLARHRRRGVKVFLASNQEHLRAEFLMTSLGLDRYCDGIFYSAALSWRKPSLEFYKKITELSGFLPEELLLIDDTPANVQAALESGWNAICWTKSSELEAQISDLQVIGESAK